ncbi:MAG: alpha/beta hydrolase [Halieaceae bacterium]|mgnify:CR=1 FL=1|jgi:alpha-beta hydrolase superfamily lysophospholipase|nr:alpha/beta hydrolase [Halieaceae bacterium]
MVQSTTDQGAPVGSRSVVPRPTAARPNAARPTPESLQALRQSLPPLADAPEASAELLEFCQFYGIDFSASYPRAVHRAGVVKSGDFTLAVHSWQQPDAQHNLLLVHGYFDHSGLYGKLIEYGLQRGCNVVIFDLPGHGLSTGEAAAIDDFADYGNAVADVLATVSFAELPWWAIAQSTGGAALIEYARHHSWKFSAAVLLAPLIRPKGWWWVNTAHSLLHRFIQSTTRGFARNSSDIAFLAFLKADPLQSRRVPLRWVAALGRWLDGMVFQDLAVGPVLVLQGDADETVAWRYNIPRFQTLFGNCQVEYLAGAGHQLANESEAIRSHYFGLMDRFLGIKCE